MVYEASVFAVFLWCSFLSTVAAIVCLRVHIAYRILHCLFLCPPTDLPLLRAALTTSNMNVEDAEFFLASHSGSKTWRGRCMWAFEDGGGPALRYGEGS